MLIVDDHPWMRRSLRQVIEALSTLRVCGDTGTVAEAVQIVQEESPDVLLIDVTLGEEGDGIELTERLVRRDPALRVLICSMHESPEFSARSLRAGAMGFINKQADVNDLVDALETVADDRLYASDATLGRLCREYIEGSASATAASRVACLELADRRLLDLIGQGCGAGEIGRRLEMSPSKLRGGRRRIFRALGIRTPLHLRYVCGRLENGGGDDSGQSASEKV